MSGIDRKIAELTTALRGTPGIEWVCVERVRYEYSVDKNGEETMTLVPDDTGISNMAAAMVRRTVGRDIAQASIPFSLDLLEYAGPSVVAEILSRKSLGALDRLTATGGAMK